MSDKQQKNTAVKRQSWSSRRPTLAHMLVFLAAMAILAGAGGTVWLTHRPAPGHRWLDAFQKNQSALVDLEAELEAIRLEAEQRAEKNTQELKEALRVLNGSKKDIGEDLTTRVAELEPKLAKKKAKTEKKIAKIKAKDAHLLQLATKRLKTLEASVAQLVAANGQDESKGHLEALRERGSEMRALRTLVRGPGANGTRIVRTDIAVHPVHPTPIRDVLTLPATVEATDDILLAAKNDGAVEWLGAKEGDRVTKNQELVRIDTSSLVETVRSSEATEKLAKANFRRMQNLRKRNVASQGDLDVAESEYEQAKAGLAIARRNLDDATLRSPIDGVLEELLPDIGEFMNRGETAAHLVNLETVKLSLDVPEKDIGYFAVGQSAQVHRPEPHEGAVDGRVSRSGVVADSLARTFTVEVTVPNPDREFLPGMITRVELVRRANANAIAIPVFVVLQTEDGPQVYVEKNGQAHARRVKLGVRQGMRVEVLEGLQSGDRLVVLGQRTLTDGAPVKVVQEYANPPSPQEVLQAAAMAGK